MTRDRERVQHHDFYVSMKAADPEYCTGRIMAIEKGVNHSNSKEKMFCRKFGWPSMKVLQIKVRRLKQFGCSLKLLANVQCTLTRKRSVLLIPASYFTNLEKKEHKCFKKSTVFILHFAPSLRFTVSLHFTPGPQSAFYTDRIQTLLFV